MSATFVRNKTTHRRGMSMSVMALVNEPSSSTIAQKLNDIEHPLLKSNIVDHLLTLLSLPTFGLAARVCKKWHAETLTGNATIVWERGVRSGEIADGRHSPFWSSMSDMRNCIVDPTSGNLISCLRDDNRRRSSMHSVSLFDPEVGGALSFSNRAGVYLRLQAWAASAILQHPTLRADTWEAKLAASVSGAIESFRIRHGLNFASNSLQRLMERVTSVACAYIGFVVVRRSSSNGIVDGMTLTSSSISKASQNVSDQEISTWCQLGARSIPLLCVLLWESRTRDALMSTIEDEDAFWTLSILNECPWYGMATFSTSSSLTIDDSHPRINQLRILLDLHIPNVINHLDRMNVNLSSFAWEWMSSLCSDVCTNENGWNVVMRIWDLFITEGWPMLMSACVVLLKRAAYAITSCKKIERLMVILKEEIKLGTDSKQMVLEMIDLQITKNDLDSSMLTSGAAHSLNNIFHSSTNSNNSNNSAAANAIEEFQKEQNVAAISASQRRTSEEDGSKEWRSRLSKGKNHSSRSMPDVIDEQLSSSNNMATSSSLRGLNKKERRVLYEKLEDVQSLLRRPVEISTVAKRLALRLGNDGIRNMLETSDVQLWRELVLKEEIGETLIDVKIFQNRPTWNTQKITTVANYLVQSTGLEGLIAMSTSKSALEDVLEDWENRNNGSTTFESSILSSSSSSIGNILNDDDEEEEGGHSGHGDGDNGGGDNGGEFSGTGETKQSKRGHARTRSIETRIPDGDESYYIQGEQGTIRSLDSNTQMRGPFSRSEMRVWFDKKVVVRQTALRVVVTHPIMYMRIHNQTECRFPTTITTALPASASQYFTDWFRAFRYPPSHPRATSPSLISISSISTLKSNLKQKVKTRNAKKSSRPSVVALQGRKVVHHRLSGIMNKFEITVEEDEEEEDEDEEEEEEDNYDDDEEEGSFNSNATSLSSSVSSSMNERATLFPSGAILPPPVPSSSSSRREPETWSSTAVQPPPIPSIQPSTMNYNESRRDLTELPPPIPTSNFPRSSDVTSTHIPRTIDAYHARAEEQGDASSRYSNSKKTKKDDEINEFKLEIDALKLELNSHNEDMNHVNKFKKEILTLKSTLNETNKEVSKLEVSLMNAINRADEASLRKQYEEGEVTSLVETYRQNATDATLAKDESDTRIAHLVTDLENSVFLERENTQLTNLLSDLNVKRKDMKEKLTIFESKNNVLAIENIKLQKMLQGQNEYHSKMTDRQSKREIVLIEKELMWNKKEQEMNVFLDAKYQSRVNDIDIKHKRTIAMLKTTHVTDLEDLAARMTTQFETKVVQLSQHHENKFNEIMEIHNTETNRWKKDKKKFDLKIRTEHNRTVAELNINVLSEVESISNEFRKVYSLARERAENHANEGWQTEAMQSRLVLENDELRKTIVDTHNKQNVLYEDLEKKLEEHDEKRRMEVMVALQTAHDVKAAHVDRIHTLEMKLNRRNRTMERLKQVGKRLKMTVEELVEKIAGSL